MKKILAILIFLSFLEACQTPQHPQSFEAKQCQPVFAYDSHGDIDLGQSFCRRRDYYIGKDFIGSRGNVVRLPLKECDQCIGYSVRDNTRIVNFMEYVRSEINEANSILEKGISGEVEESTGASEAGRQDNISATDSGDHNEVGE